MNFRELTGFVLIIISVTLTPVAWMFSRMLWLVSGLLLLLGVILFYTERVARRDAQAEGNGTGGSDSSQIPSDMHNYSGWQSGGHSETMDGAGSSDAD